MPWGKHGEKCEKHGRSGKTREKNWKIGKNEEFAEVHGDFMEV